MEYFSCREIESGIHFYRNRLNFCCVDYAQGKGFVKIIDYNGGPIPLNEIEKSRNNLRNLNQNNGDSPCKGCPNLILKDWESTAGKFDFIAIGNYSLCNLTCSYCYISKWDKKYRIEQSKPLYSVIDSFNQLIAHDKLENHIQLVWAGGEPTLYSEFDKVYEVLEKNKITSSSFIYSNCTKFSDAIFNGLKNKQIKLNCSLDSGSADTYKQIKQLNTFNTVTENLKKYIFANSEDVFIKYILLENNSSKTEIDKFINLCIQLNAKNIIISRDIFTNKQLDEKLWDAFAYLAFNAEKNGILYHFENTVFSAYDELRIKFKIIDLLAKSSFTSQSSIINHRLSEIEKNYFNSQRQFNDDIKEEKKDEIDETISSEVDELILLADDSIKWRKDYNEAIELIKLGLNLNPNSIDLLWKLSEVYAATFDQQNELSTLLTIIELKPHHKKAFIRVSELLLKNNNMFGALSFVQKYLCNITADNEIISLSEKIGIHYNSQIQPSLDCKIEKL